MNTITDFEYIDSPEQLEKFYSKNQHIEWMGFDTEFVGEKTFYPILCLIQVSTEHGFYLIDSLTLPTIEPFLKLIANPKILKITHAGENDYRLLYSQFGCVPKNVFDTQIAAGFMGYPYPYAFASLLQEELKVKLDKGSAVSDWETRPISPKQIQYALNDVVYLEKLYRQMSTKLERLNRLEWPLEEFQKLQDEASYTTDDDKEFLSNTMLNNLRDKEKLFLLRLYRWRQDQARQKNLPKERILQKKYIPHFVKAIKGGKSSLMHNRLLPEHIVHRNAKKLMEMYESDITKEEQSVIDSVSKNVRIKPRIDAVMDILYLGIKMICSEQKIAPELVINRSNFKRMKGDLTYFDESLEQTWRHQLLGDNVVNSIRHRNKLKVDTSGKYFALKM